MIKKAKVTKKDNVVNFPTKINDLDKEIEAVVLQLPNLLMLIQLKVKFQRKQMLLNR